MLINCAGFKVLSSMIIISAIFITITFPQICNEHQTSLTAICFLYFTSLIAHQSYALVIFLLYLIRVFFVFAARTTPKWPDFFD